MAEIDDGKVILKKVIIADTEEQDKAPQKEEAGPVLSDDIKMLVTSMIHKDGKAFARVSFLRDNDWAEGIVPGGLRRRKVSVRRRLRSWKPILWESRR